MRSTFDCDQIDQGLFVIRPRANAEHAFEYAEIAAAPGVAGILPIIDRHASAVRAG